MQQLSTQSRDRRQNRKYLHTGSHLIEGGLEEARPLPTLTPKAGLMRGLLNRPVIDAEKLRLGFLAQQHGLSGALARLVCELRWGGGGGRRA